MKIEIPPVRKEILKDAFPTGVADYPEGHIEVPSLEVDLVNLKIKVHGSTDFIITADLTSAKGFGDDHASPGG